MDYALSIFCDIKHPNPFIWNTMIRGYVENGALEDAILFYKYMHECNVIPDCHTFPFVLKESAHLLALREGIQIHGLVLKSGFDSDIYVQNSLISMYRKCFEVRSCEQVFDQMSRRTIASWSALISAYTKFGLYDEGLCVFEVMQIEGWKADVSTLASVLTICANLGALNLGRCAHAFFIRTSTHLNHIVNTSLIDMYAKCGFLEKSMYLFNTMTKRKNLHTYSVMISGLAMHGCVGEALETFSEMLLKNLDPDEAVYVGVLTAYSHAGLVDEGLHFFENMRIQHGISPTVRHYGCLVDLLGRAGMLEEAVKVIEKMSVQPNDVVWRALLNACRIHRNAEIAELAFRMIIDLGQQQAGDYVLIANVCAGTKRWDDMAAMRMRMVKDSMFQTPGFSVIEVKRKIHRFVSHDKSHPQHYQIYKMLHQIELKLRTEGYTADTSEVLYDVDEEEKRWLVAGHSQKLAIAFALISTEQGTPVRIFKNIRMCNDCHAATALVSKIFKREIIVRERSRFHHFKEGFCSCKNYW